MEITPTERVAQNIRVELARQGCGQKEIAATLGVSQQAVSRRMTGEIAFDVNELVAIAALLHVDLASLTSGVDATPTLASAS